MLILTSMKNWVSAHIAKFYELANINSAMAKAADFTIDFNVMSLQRHLKVLVSLSAYKRDGKDRYLGNMPKVMGDF